MYTYKYPRPSVTADCIVFAKVEDELQVLLVQRKNEPYKGDWAFPGGFMNMDETTAEAARRELKEETGLDVDEVHPVGVYDAVGRDPRGRVITVAYFTIVSGMETVRGGDDAAQARWFPVEGHPKLAFDHEEILSRAVWLYYRAAD